MTDSRNRVSQNLSDDDIRAAMQDMQGYIDITPADLRELYLRAYRHALDRLSRSVRASDIMTQDVVSVLLKTPIQEVAALMADRGVSGLPVLDGQAQVAGIISEKDFLGQMGSGSGMTLMHIVAECLQGRSCSARPVRGKSAQDIMTSPAVTVGPDTPAGEIATLLSSRKINRVPVVDGEGRLVGIVSREDIVSASTVSTGA